jgi:hypothetical protein
MARNRPRGTARSNAAATGEGKGGGSDIARLRRELAEAQTLLKQLSAGTEGQGAVAMARRMAKLEEERQVARGHAVDAALARSAAEAELKKLRDAIFQATGVQGWLLRRAALKVGVK